MVPADVLGKLPNLQYFASVSGGRIIKGRFPILDPGEDEPKLPKPRPATATALAPGQVP
jgi:conjugal transfer pilus assembly protein TraD